MDSEEGFRWLIVIIFLSILGGALIFSRKNRVVMLSFSLSIFSLKFFILGVYSAGLTVGDEPSGYAEGKFVALSIMLMALFCSIFLLLALCAGVYAYRIRSEFRYKAMVSISTSLLFLSIVWIPLASLLITWQFEIFVIGIQSLNWLSAVYTIAEWSRALDPPLY